MGVCLGLQILLVGAGAAAPWTAAAWLAPSPIPTITSTPAPLPSPTALPSRTPQPRPSETLAPTYTSLPTSTPDSSGWREWPVIPAANAHAAQIFALGQERGANPRVFSKVGDSNSTMPFFLACFDQGPRAYNLGAYTDLQPAVDHFAGSFARTSRVARNGLTATGALSLDWGEDGACLENESALACEYRLYRPSYAFVALGTNDVNEGPALFEQSLRRILEFTLEQGIVPIVATKADNLEGDESFNGIIARLAMEYDLPVWNLWRATRELPGYGLREDGAHFTYSPSTGGLCQFDRWQLPEYGWPNRNLTALQALDAVWRMSTP